MSNFTLEECNKLRNQSIDNAKATGLKLTAFIIGTQCCAECDKINEKRIQMEELLKAPILPYSKCTRKPFCICCYGFEPMRDEKGVLIEKKY